MLPAIVTVADSQTDMQRKQQCEMTRTDCNATVFFLPVSVKNKHATYEILFYLHIFRI